MIGDGAPRYPSTAGVHASIHSLDARVARVEAQTSELPQVVKDVGEIKEYLRNVKSLEGFARGILGKGALLIIGAVGSSWGVSRATETAPQANTTQIVKSATTVKVEACTAMQPGPERDQCAIRILTELMGPQSR